MAKKFKLSANAILFLAAILVLVIALVVVIVVVAKNCDSCKKNTTPQDGGIDISSSAEPTGSFVPVDSASPDVSTDPNAAIDPNATADPNASGSPSTTDGNIGITTPAPTNTPDASTTVYTEPTDAMRSAAKKGYVSKADVNMRKGPATTYDIVTAKLAKGTSLTLYTEQSGWWFVKAGSKYGYIKNDYVKEGEYSGTTDGTITGTVNVNSGSVAALRKDASKSSKCIKEYSKGDTMTIYYKSDDGAWYYVKMSDGKKGWMYASLISASGKVPTKG